MDLVVIVGVVGMYALGRASCRSEDAQDYLHLVSGIWVVLTIFLVVKKVDPLYWGSGILAFLGYAVWGVSALLRRKANPSYAVQPLQKIFRSTFLRKLHANAVSLT